MSTKTPLTIDYYSDVLCVWAWIAQRRVDELQNYFSDQIQFSYHHIDVFGNTAVKMQSQWADRGGYEGFGQHVIQSAAPFEDTKVNPAIWSKVKPTTSANAHLWLKAIDSIYGADMSAKFAVTVRKAFFCDAQDISQFSVLGELSGQLGLEQAKIHQLVENGEAIALLASDYKNAQTLNIKGSPSYVLDGGRQTLYGNVGYRVLHANIEELLKHPKNEASWC
ncbi:MAG: DsbA family protein [Kangiellaceae bacterium]|jgi:predicted DsbA family dithiol-disulfide isomerase|nr:DsbA family protein [Kangiellaceae bacterium]